MAGCRRGPSRRSKVSKFYVPVQRSEPTTVKGCERRAPNRSTQLTKLKLGLIEPEETLYWLELLEEAGIIPGSKLTGLKGETSELSAIFVTLIKQARENPKSQS